METLENRLQKRIHASLYALLFLTGLLGLSVLLEGCTDKCDVTYRYTYFEPVYMSMEEIRTMAEVTVPQPMEQVGKIYYKDGILFINEPGKGIHLVDNHDPAQPRPLKFLQIPGNYDLAIRGNTLYADSYVDLVAFDVSNLEGIREVARLENIFNHYVVLGSFQNNDERVLTDFVQKSNVEIVESECGASVRPWGGILYDEGIALRYESLANFSAQAAIAPGQGSGSGVGGSMARFTINGTHLYLLNGADLQSINVSTPNAPIEGTRTTIGWDIETIFPYKQYLFIGSSSGMHIIDVSDRDAPVRLSTYAHVRSCDPVVVDDQYAYVTLRSGTMCQGFTNQLEVIDISNLAAPELLATYPMTNPHGLGLDGKLLFVCDGNDGLKAFDASDVYAINQRKLAHYKGIHAYDVIPFNDVLIMIGADGLFQYDYSDPKAIRLLSTLPLRR